MAKRGIDFIRYLLDYIDQKIEDKFDKEKTCAVKVVTTDEGPSSKNPIDDDKRFIPPLQANIEMMKKLSGVPTKDETLAQSQQQGGPAGGSSPTSDASDIAKVLGVLDNSMFSQ